MEVNERREPLERSPLSSNFFRFLPPSTKESRVSGAAKNRMAHIREQREKGGGERGGGGWVKVVVGRERKSWRGEIAVCSSPIWEATFRYCETATGLQQVKEERGTKSQGRRGSRSVTVPFLSEHSVSFLALNFNILTIY